MSRLLRWVSLLLVIAIFTLPASAQEDKSVDLYDFVMQAMRNTSTLFSYHFTFRQQNLNTFTFANDQSYSLILLSIGDGSASATGDFSISASLRSADTVDNLQFITPLRYQRNFVDDEDAYNFWIDNTIYENLLPFTSGWQSEEMLEAAIEGTEYQGIVGNVDQVSPPADFSNQINMINSITEDDPEVINNISFRVFDIEINGLGAVLASMSNRRREELEARLKNPLFRAEVEFERSYRLWINEEDQQIYRATTRSMFNMPYLSAGYDDEYPYDWYVEGEGGFTISRHNQPVKIEQIELENG